MQWLGKLPLRLRGVCLVTVLAGISHWETVSVVDFGLIVVIIEVRSQPMLAKKSAFWTRLPALIVSSSSTTAAATQLDNMAFTPRLAGTLCWQHCCAVRGCMNKGSTACCVNKGKPEVTALAVSNSWHSWVPFHSRQLANWQWHHTLCQRQAAAHD